MRLLGAIAALAALEAGVAAAAVRVESDSSCPSADAVRKELDALGGRDAARSVSMMVRSHSDRLTVELAWPGDAQSETREVDVASDCESRAQAAAVVAASWLGILPGVSLQSHPLGTPPVEIQKPKTVPLASPTVPPVVPSPPTPRSVSPASPPEPQPSVGPPQPEPASTAPASLAQTHLAVEAPHALEPRRSWLGIGLGGSAGGGLVPGMRVELVRLRASTGLDLGWMTSTMVSMPRSTSIDGGTSKWIRPAIGVAGLASWRSNRVQLGLDLGPLLGLTVAWGSGFPANETDTSITWGLTGGLRLQMVADSSQYWIELRMIDWLRTERLQHEVLPSGPSVSASLPSLEGLVSAGWSFAL
jgi:hypothetical protein